MIEKYSDQYTINEALRKTTQVQTRSKQQGLLFWLDAFVLLCMCALLYYGASWQYSIVNSDAARYQCYATAFWHGLPAVQTLPAMQCPFLTQPTSDTTALTQEMLLDQMRAAKLPAPLLAFVARQSPAQPLHSLPGEYPLLTLIPFSLALLAPPVYQIAFAFEMILLASVLFLFLLHWKSRSAAYVYAFYIVVGAWSTAAGRYDVVPALLCFIALLSALRTRWNWAFALLALATLSKFYPLILLLPFFIAQQRTLQGVWYRWKRWQPFAVFVAVSLLVMSLSLLLSVTGTLSPLSYFGYRPVQIESLLSSLTWLVSLLGETKLSFAYTFGSLNVLSSNVALSSALSLLVMLLLAAALLFTYWLQWIKKIDLATASLLTLLIVMVTGKVFSPQYLLWIIPLLAYIGERRLVWVVCWGLIGSITSAVFPYVYNQLPILLVPTIPLFYPLTTLRNLLLLAFIGYLLFSSARKLPIQHVADEVADKVSSS